MSEANDPKTAPKTKTAEPKTVWFRNPWIWAAVIGVIAIPLLRPFCKSRMRRVPKPPAVIAKLPAFELTNQHGKPFGSKDLRGKVWVANMIFTSCRSICPRLTAQMMKLQKRYQKQGVDIRLVSISVDPETDTPKKLLDFAQTAGVDFKRWTWLTGPLAKIRALIIKGFKIHMGEKVKDANGLIDIAHTGKFVLVDRQGNIRGFYDSDDQGIDEVFHRSQHVLNAK